MRRPFQVDDAIVFRATGEFERGHVRVVDMVTRQPWADDLPVYDVDVMASHVAEALEGIGYRAWIEGPGGLVGISWEHVRGRAARKLVLDGMAPAPEPATRRGRGRGRGQGQGRGRVRGRARGLVLEL